MKEKRYVVKQKNVSDTFRLTLYWSRYLYNVFNIKMIYRNGLVFKMKEISDMPSSAAIRLV